MNCCEKLRRKKNGKIGIKIDLNDDKPAGTDFNRHLQNLVLNTTYYVSLISVVADKLVSEIVFFYVSPIFHSPHFQFEFQ